jgi:hypothetical protein
MIVHGNIERDGFELVLRDGRFFIRYDAGAHQAAWREDEVSKEDARRISESPDGFDSVVRDLQDRLLRSGGDPYVHNWRGPESGLA